MASLVDHVDRISALARSIRASAAPPDVPIPGPFTRAILDTPLGDLIRDIDPSELGLFTQMVDSLSQSKNNIPRSVFDSQSKKLNKANFQIGVASYVSCGTFFAAWAHA